MSHGSFLCHTEISFYFHTEITGITERIFLPKNNVTLVRIFLIVTQKSRKSQKGFFFEKF